jgi:hypothetical protein
MKVARQYFCVHVGSWNYKARKHKIYQNQIFNLILHKGEELSYYLPVVEVTITGGPRRQTNCN